MRGPLFPALLWVSRLAEMEHLLVFFRSLCAVFLGGLCQPAERYLQVVGQTFKCAPEVPPPAPHRRRIGFDANFGDDRLFPSRPGTDITGVYRPHRGGKFLYLVVVGLP